MRVVFMGTPAESVPSLRAVDEAFDVVGVYTRPDRARGRGLRVQASPVKLVAMELGLRVLQPKTLRAEADRLRELEPDVVTVVAYGALLPPAVLETSKLGCVNVHFSLLPRWRGAAPVERCLLAGDESTGVSTMLMDEGLDTGPVLLCEETTVRPGETAGSLRSRLAEMGAPLLVQTLSALETGGITPQPQDDSLATLAPKVEADEAELDPRLPAAVLERRVRAFHPSPGAFVWFRGARLKVLRAALEPGGGDPGKLVGDGQLLMQTAEGRLRLLEVQPEGKRAMAADDFARGRRPKAGEAVGSLAGD